MEKMQTKILNDKSNLGFQKNRFKKRIMLTHELSWLKDYVATDEGRKSKSLESKQTNEKFFFVIRNFSNILFMKDK